LELGLNAANWTTAGVARGNVRRRVPIRFNYKEAWRLAQLECPTCHWKGTFEQGSVEYYAELTECWCPECDISTVSILAIVSRPTVAEMAYGHPHGIRQGEWIENTQREFNSRKLVSKEQLPDVDAAIFELTWDSAVRSGKRWTVIQHGDHILFSEPEVWGGFASRFEEVCRILREKYGERVADLVPSQASKLYLYGDSLSAEAQVAKVRKRIFGGSEIQSG